MIIVAHGHPTDKTLARLAARIEQDGGGDQADGVAHSIHRHQGPQGVLQRQAARGVHQHPVASIVGYLQPCTLDLVGFGALQGFQVSRFLFHALGTGPQGRDCLLDFDLVILQGVAGDVIVTTRCAAKIALRAEDGGDDHPALRRR